MDYKEIETYKDVDSFIEGMQGIWHMFGSTYKKLDAKTICIDNNITWKLMKGEMRCLEKR